VLRNRGIPVVNNAIFDEMGDPAISVFDPWLYKGNRYEKLEEFKWFLGQRANMKITIFYVERDRAVACSAGKIGTPVGLHPHAVNVCESVIIKVIAIL
jgi:hypothetical protein